ncbi:hypothetical protein CLM85_24065 [Streptomyces albidoflavus]|nr:hypothetical protein CLM85_24065 [Streptomyces albidoflavus]
MSADSTTERPAAPGPRVASVRRRTPDELPSVVQDLTTVRDNVGRSLALGRYPDRASGAKVPGMLRAGADQLDV